MTIRRIVRIVHIVRTHARELTLGLIAAALIVSSGRDPGACGPFLPQALFSFERHPDFPLETFARGELGVLQPTYARSYLIVAYRHLNGLPVADAEATALVALWKTRLFGQGAGSPSDAAADGASTAPDGAAGPAGGRPVSGETVWRDARRAITGEAGPAELSTMRAVPGEQYQWYPNVQDAAFRQAAATLNARTSSLGKDRAELRAWISAQDLVFTSGNGVPPGLTPLPASAPAEARADRAYQIAAARFYAGEFAQAREAFLSISRDSSSPWRGWGAYLAARCLLRQATVDPVKPAEAERLLTQATQEFDAIAADGATAANIRESSRGLSRRARLWRDLAVTDQGKPTALRAAAETVLARTPGAAIGAALDRLTVLLDREDRLSLARAAEKGGNAAAPPAPTPPASVTSSADASQPALTDLVSWLDVVQRVNRERHWYEADREPAIRAGAAEDAIARWRKSHTLPWLVASLMYVSASNPGAGAGAPGPDDVEALLGEAARVPESSPAYATVAFHRARLLLERRDRPTARALLDRALNDTSHPSLPPSARNLLGRLRLRTARSRDEFFADAARPSVATTTIDDTVGIDLFGPNGHRPVREYLFGQPADIDDRLTGRRLFDDEAATLVNRLPVAELVAAAQSTALPAPLRRDVALAAWTRALRLDDREQGRLAAPLVRVLAPVLAEDVDAYLAAKTPIDARIAGLWAILRAPGLSGVIEPGLGRLTAVRGRDLFRDNWWCGGDGTESRYLGAPALPQTSAEFAAYLSEAERSKAAGELKALRPAGGTFLPRAVVQWAQDRPDDPRLPEALHRAVLATRYGCTDADTGGASKAAFELLHRRFPTSTWAKQTPYWYK